MNKEIKKELLVPLRARELADLQSMYHSYTRDVIRRLLFQFDLANERLETIRKHYGRGKQDSHILSTSKACGCNVSPVPYCAFCDGGLTQCIICGAAEAQIDDFTCDEFIQRSLNETV